MSEILFPLHERLKGHDTVKRVRELERSQWRGAAEIRAGQEARLGEFLRSIRQHVPFYRKVLAERDFGTGRPISVDDLRDLPFLTKQTIREHAVELKSERAGKLIKYNTGGSSGEPLVFYMGPDRVSQDVAAKWRATRWWNVDIGDRELVVWGSPIELGTQDYIKTLRDRLFRTKLLSAFAMSERVLDSFVDQIRTFRPAMLFGYPSALELIARRAQDRGIDLTNAGVRVAFVTAEKLYDTQRTIISRVFACPVANGYGSRDAGFIAHECPEGGMHITSEEIVVEIIGEDDRPVASGMSGEIVITNTATQDFPFLRYRTGDMGMLDSAMCRCGRGLPLLKEVQGRSTDFLIAIDGSRVHALALIYVIRSLPTVQRFRIVQEAANRIRIAVVATPSLSREQESKIAGEVKQRMGEAMQVIVEAHAHLESEKSGKFRYVKNLMLQNSNAL